jgi:hypothetical protein
MHTLCGLKKKSKAEKLIGVDKKQKMKSMGEDSGLSYNVAPVLPRPLKKKNSFYLLFPSVLYTSFSAFFFLLISIFEPSKSPNTNTHQAKKISEKDEKKLMTKT